jgi:hypothetical protein
MIFLEPKNLKIMRVFTLIKSVPEEEEILKFYDSTLVTDLVSLMQTCSNVKTQKGDTGGGMEIDATINFVKKPNNKKVLK